MVSFLIISDLSTLLHPGDLKVTHSSHAGPTTQPRRAQLLNQVNTQSKHEDVKQPYGLSRYCRDSAARTHPHGDMGEASGDLWDEAAGTRKATHVDGVRLQLGVVPNRPREINCRVVPVFLLGIRQLGCRLVPRRLFASSTQTFDYRGG